MVYNHFVRYQDLLGIFSCGVHKDRVEHPEGLQDAQNDGGSIFGGCHLEAMVCCISYVQLPLLLLAPSVVRHDVDVHRYLGSYGRDVAGMMLIMCIFYTAVGRTTHLVI